MWWYLYAHGAYHLYRWFSQNNRSKISALLILIALLMPLPQFYIIRLEESSGYCEYQLLELNVVSIILTIFTIGFTTIFCSMPTVPRSVKTAFHVFGIVSFTVGASFCINTWLSIDSCSYYTTKLWILSLVQSCLALLSSAFIFVTLPFWLINEAKTNFVLDPYSRTGICYGPATCCSCLWHI